MADLDWDADNFEPVVATPHVPGVPNKWEGEDEDNDIKESWEEVLEEKKEEEKKDENKAEIKPKTKPKKRLTEKIAEKEKKSNDVEKSIEEMTPEEKLEEKLRRQKLQEESDLEMAKLTFGVMDDSKGIDGMNPTTKEEFSELQQAICKKLTAYSKNPEFPMFIEELIRNICVPIASNDLKKIKLTLDNMVLEKQKIEKGEKAKKSKAKGKVSLKVEGNNRLDEFAAYGDYDDFNDFM